MAEFSEIKTEVVGDKVVVEIPAQFLENAFEMGVTTNCTGKVLDKDKMLKYFAKQFADGSDGSRIGYCIDSICEDALESEEFVEPDEY